jgi:hypothetical protein
LGRCLFFSCIYNFGCILASMENLDYLYKKFILQQSFLIFPEFNPHNYENCVYWNIPPQGMWYWDLYQELTKIYG